MTNPGTSRGGLAVASAAIDASLMSVRTVGRGQKEAGVHQDPRPSRNSARRISPDRSARAEGPSKLAKNKGVHYLIPGQPPPRR